VYTSKVFAILGLRSMFFALSGLVTMFRYLHYGLSAILVFVGAKMMLGVWITITTLISLIIIAGLLIVSVIASVLHAGPAKKD
jgi:tellurite resistance protein TerC